MNVGDKVVVTPPELSRPFAGWIVALNVNGNNVNVKDHAGNVITVPAEQVEVFISHSQAKRIAIQRGG